MSRSASIFGRIWTNLRNSMGAPRQEVKLVGRDHLGNSYFEKSPDLSRNLKGSRYVEAENPDQFLAPTVPVEWTAWLQGRRQIPPKQEELDRNEIQKLRTVLRAKELEEKERLERGELPIKSKGIASDIDDLPDQNKFPVYPGFENKPGEFEEMAEKDRTR